MRFIAVVCGLAVGMVSVASAEPVMEETIASDVLLSGEANERLQDIGRRAAEQELVLQVNAPDIWESEILTPLRQGAGDTRLEVKFVNTMRDTATIRGVEASKAEDPLETLKRITNDAKARSVMDEMERDEGTAREEEAASSRRPPSSKSPSSRPDIEKPDTNVPEVRIERPSPDMPQSNPGNSSRRLYDEGMVRQSAESPQPEVDDSGPVPAPDDDVEQAESAASTDDDRAAAKEKRRLEGLYNNGRAIRRTLSADELEEKDLIYSGNHHNVVVRKGITRKTFWLEGVMPERRVEHQERNRYVVVESNEEG
jgi:hypothetical protein